MEHAVDHRFSSKVRARPAELEARALGRFELDAQVAESPTRAADLEQINVWLATDLRLYKREITRPSNGSPLLRVIFKRESAPHSPQQQG